MSDKRRFIGHLLGGVLEGMDFRLVRSVISIRFPFRELEYCNW